MARVWALVTLLGLLVVVALAVRTNQGWAPTKREALRAQCARGELASCTLLGDDLLYGRNGPTNREEALEILDDACASRSGSSCALLGEALIASGFREDRVRAEVVLKRGCELKSGDACGHLGKLEILNGRRTEGLARLRENCARSSPLSCRLLGEQGLFSSDVRPDEANAAFARGCAGGDRWACFRNAQAFICGRGVDVDPQRALPALREACENELADACTELLPFEGDGGVLVSSREHSRAVIASAFGHAQVESFDEARQAISMLDGGVPFAVAAIEVAAGNFDAAERALELAPKEQPETKVVREVLQARRGGKPWPDAAWLGWKNAGMPDLRKSEWLRPEIYTRQGCSKPSSEPVDSEAAFVRAVAETQRSRLDERFDAPVVNAAMRYASSERLSIALLALGVLREKVKDGGSDAIVEFERAARRSFAQKHNGGLVLEFVALPPNLRWSAAPPDDIEQIVERIQAPDVVDRPELYDDYVRLLGPEMRNRALAFGVLVFALSPVDESQIPGWLERAELDEAERAEALRTLGGVMVKRTWLVERYQGTSLLRASLALEEDEETGALLRSTTAELAELHSGSTGMRSFAQLPFQSLDLDKAVEDEVPQLRRLHALVSP